MYYGRVCGVHQRSVAVAVAVAVAMAVPVYGRAMVVPRHSLNTFTCYFIFLSQRLCGA